MDDFGAGGKEDPGYGGKIEEFLLGSCIEVNVGDRKSVSDILVCSIAKQEAGPEIPFQTSFRQSADEILEGTPLVGIDCSAEKDVYHISPPRNGLSRVDLNVRSDT